MSYDSLREAIVENIRPNGNQEITGQALQDALLRIIDEAEAADRLAAPQATTYTKTEVDERTKLFVGGIGFEPEKYISEIYILEPYTDGIYLNLKSSGDNLLFVLGDGVSAKTPVVSSNGVVYPVSVYSNTQNVEDLPIGKIVGYVVFKNVNGFLALGAYYNNNESAYQAYARDLSNSPTIASYLIGVVADGTVNTSNLADNAVTFSKLYQDVYAELPNEELAYQNTITDIFIDPKYMADVTKINVRYYYGDIIIRGYIAGTIYWTARINIEHWKNGIVYNIIATANNFIGETVGYILFGDIEKFRSYSTTSQNAIIDIDYATSPLQKNHLAIYMAIDKGDVECVLPSQIDVVVGDTLQLFYRACIRSINPYNYDIVALCDVGKNYPRYYQLTPTAVGTHTLTLEVKKNDGTIIASATTLINVVNKMTSPSADKKVLMFGASATASGAIAYELRRRLTETIGDNTPYNPTGLGLSNITFVGRKTGYSFNVPVEATGGWSWKDYATQGRAAYRFQVSGVGSLNIGDTYSVNDVTLTITEINVTEGVGNIRCTYDVSATIPTSGTLTRTSGSGDATISYSSVESEAYNPFWNDGSIDFSNYATTYCGGSIDVLISHCGVNDLFSSRTIDETIGYVKDIARAYHSDFPSGKFIISTLPLPDCTGGMGANYGASSNNYYAIAQRIWDFANAVDELVQDAEFSPYVTVAPIVQLFDCENLYPKAEVSVANRSNRKELLGTNGVHPTTEGAYTVADSIFAAFNKLSF